MNGVTRISSKDRDTLSGIALKHSNVKSFRLKSNAG